MLLLAAVAIPLGLDLYMPVPEDNTITPEKIERAMARSPAQPVTTLTAPSPTPGYDRCGNPNPYLDAERRPLYLSAVEKQNLLAFLRCLTAR